MSNVLVEESSLRGIADAIREKNGSEETYTPSQMARAVSDIPTGIPGELDDVPTENSDNAAKSGGIYTALQGKQNTLTFDSFPTENSLNPVTSHGIYIAIFGLTQTIAALAERVAALEGGDYVEDHYLIANSGAVSDNLLELRNATVRNNYIIIGESSSGVSVEGNYLVANDDTVSGNVLDLGDGTISGNVIDFDS